MRFAFRVAALRQFATVLPLLAALTLPLPLSAQEQAQAWLQIEARSTRTEATERAEAYAGLFAHTHGFRLPSGWYAIALGPYSPAEAASVLATLKSENLIPRDSYVTDGREYREAFWDNGLAADATVPAIETAPIALAPPEASPPPESVPPAEGSTALPAFDSETPAEARRSEAELSPDAKRELQVAMQWFGFYQGSIDGAFGSGTRNSMAAWQSASGLEATGVLTSLQRETLITNFNAEVDGYGFAAVEEGESGINVTLPLALVEFDRYEPPFVHYREKNGSGLSIMLISQPGDQGAFNGLYDLLQTLEAMPTTGERQRRDSEFSIQGSSATRTAWAWAQRESNLIKGWMAISSPEHASRDARALQMLGQSFRAIGDTALDPGLVPLDAAARRGLLAGLEIRKPKSSASGFYITAQGAVLTAASTVAQCGKITLDRQHEAKVTLVDDASGMALLTPAVALAPKTYGQLQTAPARIGSEIAVAGYSYGERLPAPVLSWGTLEELTGLDGEAGLTRLAIMARPGDSGGPVLDAAGAVIGMLLPAASDASRSLPAGTSFAAAAGSLAVPLASQGITMVQSGLQPSLTPEALTRHATAMTVLVSCWE